MGEEAGLVSGAWEGYGRVINGANKCAGRAQGLIGVQKWMRGSRRISDPFWGED